MEGGRRGREGGMDGWRDGQIEGGRERGRKGWREERDEGRGGEGKREVDKE